MYSALNVLQGPPVFLALLPVQVVLLVATSMLSRISVPCVQSESIPVKQIPQSVMNAQQEVMLLLKVQLSVTLARWDTQVLKVRAYVMAAQLVNSQTTTSVLIVLQDFTVVLQQPIVRFVPMDRVLPLVVLPVMVVMLVNLLIMETIPTADPVLLDRMLPMELLSV
jgi:hypothetical protein